MLSVLRLVVRAKIQRAVRVSLQAGTCLALLFTALVLSGQATQTWTQLAPSGSPPVARIIHSAVYAQATNRMIVFGGFVGDPDSGFCGPSCRNDVWVLANADGTGGSPSWTQLSPTGTPPSARAYHSAVYDAASNRMVVYAGDPSIGFCFGALNDVWVLTNADGTGGTPDWTKLSPTGTAPDLRQGPKAVYDPATNRMMVFGGNNNACVPFNDGKVWVLTNANGLGGTPAWTPLSVSSAGPSGRIGNSSVYDAANNRMVVFGGSAAGGLLNDVWVLENANGLGGPPVWTQLIPTGGSPTARSSHTAVYDPATNHMVVFGGSTAAGLTDEIWELTNANGFGGAPVWAQRTPSGVPPTRRSLHTAVLNTATDRMTVYAGENCVPGDCFDVGDVWVLTGAVAPLVTTLTLAPAVGIYSGTADLQATLSSPGGVISGATVDFTLGGLPIGSATTNGSGVATLNGVSIAGRNAGTYLGIVGASFAGTTSIQASSVTGALIVGQATPSIGWPFPAPVTYGEPLGPTQLNAAATFNGSPLGGTFAYTPGAGTVLNAGVNQALSALFTPTDAANYQSVTASRLITVSPSSTSTTLQTWSQFAPGGTGPAFGGGTYGAAEFNDGAGHVIVVSADGSNPFVLSGASGLTGAPTWTSYTAPGHPVQKNAAAAYDRNSNSLMMYGGCGSGCTPITNQVWVLSHANGAGGTPTWTNRTPASNPAPRQGMARGYDPTSNRLIIFGGQDGGGSGGSTYPEVWVLTNANGTGGGSTWSQLLPGNAGPPGQYAPSSWYDGASNRLIVAGGGAQGSGTPTNAVWALTNANGLGGTPLWVNLIAEGAAGSPGGFYFWPAAYDAATNRAMLVESGTSNIWVITNANGLGGTPTYAHVTLTGGPTALTDNLNAPYDAANHRLSIVSSASQVFVLGSADATGVINPSIFSQPVTFTATVSPIAPGTGTRTGTVTFKNGAATLGTAAVDGAGQATFTTSSIPISGSPHTITAVYSGDANFTTSTSSPHLQTVTVGAPDHLAFAQQPGGTAAGSAISPGITVRIEDSFNNLTTSTGSVTLAIGTNSGGGTLSGTATVAAVAGVATFSNLSINKTGTGYTLRATSASLTQADSTGFDITPGAAAKLAFTTQPGNGTGGSKLSTQPAIAIQDASGNTVTTAANVITLAIGTNPSSGTLSNGGDSFATNATAGVVIFSFVSIDKAGNGYTLTASAAGLAGATSSAFNITVGAPNKMVVTSVGGAVVGAPLTPQPVVTIQDAGGNTVTTSSAPINAFFAANPTGATLGGTKTVNAVAGVATFTGLSVNRAGTGYRLNVGCNVNCGGLLLDISAGLFDVTPAGTTTAVTSSATPSAFGQSVTFTATVSVAAPGAGTPSGTVTFTDGATTLGAGTLAGAAATLTTSSLTPGDHTMTATYNSDGSFSASTGSVNQRVADPITSVAVTPPTPTINVDATQAFTATATYGSGATGVLRTADSWTSGMPLAVTSYGLGTAVVNGQLYVISGYYTPRVARYDPLTNSWTNLASLPVAPLQYFGTAVIGTKIYVVGGDTGGSGQVATLYAYETTTNSWITNLPPMPGGGRYSLSAAAVSGKLYAVGGINSSGQYTARVEVYDPGTNGWSTLPTGLSVARSTPAVGGIGGRLYAAGGGTPSGAVGTLDIYNPSTNSWTTGASMPNPRDNPGAVADGQLWVVGSGPSPQNQVHSYSPTTNTWTQHANLPTARYALGVAADEASGKVFAVGGYNAGFQNALEILQPFQATWSTGAPGVASVTAAGVATGVTAGTSVMTATTLDGVSGNTTLTVHPNDTTAPTTVATRSPIANAAGWNNTSVTVTLNATDNAGGSGVQSIFSQTSGAQNGSSNTPGSSKSITIFAEGTSTFTYHAIDIAGNVEADRSVAVSIDMTPPQINVQNVAVDATSSAGAVVSFSPAVTDSRSGISTVTSTPASGSTFAIGTTTVQVTAVDLAGNSATRSFTVTVNRALLSISVSPSPTTLSPGQNQTFQAVGHFSDGSTQMLPSGNGGGGPSGGSLWNVNFASGIGVNPVTCGLSSQGNYFNSEVIAADPSTGAIIPTVWEPANPLVQVVSGQITSTQISFTVMCTTSSATGSFSATWNGQAYVGTFNGTAGQSAPVTISPNSSGGNTGSNPPLWSLQFVSPIDVSVCATAQHPAPIAFASQGFADVNGSIHETWSPGTPVVTADGTVNASDVVLSVACTNGAATGTISAHWTGTRYAGTFSFNGGASAGAVDITGWSRQADMPTRRFSFGAATVSGLVYAIGGANELSFVSTVDAYNPAANTWTTGLQSMPTPREGLGVAALGGRIYAIGGHVAGGTASGVAEAYDPVLNSWSTLPQMPTARAAVAVVTDGTYVYTLGGDTTANGGGAVATVERYDPSSNNWSTLAPMPSAGRSIVAGVLNGTIVVAGGGSANSSATDVYDIASNTWHAGAPMPAGRSTAAGGVANGGLYVFGGTVNGQLAYDTWVYYPATSTHADYWSGFGSIPTGRWELAAAVVNDVVYALGGAAQNSVPVSPVSANEALSTPPVNTFSAGGGTGAGGGGSSSLPTVQWQSTSPSIAGVDGGGNAHANVPGQTTIVATASNGLSCTASNTCATLTVAFDDTTPPTTNANVQSPNVNGWYKFNVNVNLNAFDSGGAASPSGVRSITYTLTGAQTGGGTFDNTSSTSVSIFTEGSTTLTYHATDNANNAEADHTLVVRLDKTSPSAASLSSITANATSSAGAVVTFNLAPSDALSGIDTVVFTQGLASGSTFPHGTTNESVTITDKAGNNTFRSFSVTVNKTLLSIAVSPTTASVNVSGSQSFQAMGHFTSGPDQVLPTSGSGGGGGGSVLAGGTWQLVFTPSLDVSACGVVPNPFTRQPVSPDASGNVNTSWGSPALVQVTGTVTPQQVSLALACIPSNGATGTITANWTGTSYEGTVTLSGSSHPVSIRGWSTKSAMPTARFGLAAATANGRVYVFGGAAPGALLGAVESYDPATDAWTGNLAPMPTPREGSRAVTLSNLIYVVGGHSAGGVASGAIEAFNPATNTWTTGLTPMPTPRSQAAVVTTGGKLYALGGDTGSGGSAPTAAVEVYDPSTNQWAALAPMPTPRSGLAAGVLDGGTTIIAAGGSTSSGPSSLNGQYTIATNTWGATGPSMLVNTSGAAAVVVNNALFVFGGSSPTTVEMFRPAGNSLPAGWAAMPPMPTGRTSLAVAAVGDVVYAFGGLVSGQASGLSTVEAFSTPRPNDFQVSSGSGGGGGGSSLLPIVQWQSTNQSVSNVNSSGFASGNAPGQSAIVATASVNGSTVSCVTTGTCATLTVVDPNCAQVTLNVIAGSGVPFTTIQGIVDGDPEPFEIPIGVNTFGTEAGSFTVHFQAPPGYVVTPSQLTITALCGDHLQFDIHVDAIDTTPPVLTVPGNKTAEAAGSAGAAVSFAAATATDAGSGVASVSCDRASGSTFAIGATMVHCSATDNAGNTANESFTVTVQDTTPPAIALNGTNPIAIEGGSTFTDPGASASDSVDGNLTGAMVVTGVVNANVVGSYTLTYTVSDHSGNTQTATRTVSVIDTTRPTLTLPASVTVDATSPAGAIVIYTASATDLVSGPLAVTCTPPSGNMFPIGTTTVNCTSVDGAGNSAGGSFQVLVQAAAAQVTNLMVAVQGFNLAQGIESSLDTKLQNVLSALNAAKSGSVGTVCNQMIALINETMAQSGKKLTVAQANQLIASARQIEAVIGCQ